MQPPEEEAQAPGSRAEQPHPEQPPVELIEATKEEIWTLGNQQWDFRDVSATYVPVKGSLNPQTGVAQWTLEIVREMTPGEVGMQENLDGTPFKPSFLDKERVALQEDSAIRLPAIRLSKITGNVGDRVRLTLRLPPEEALGAVRFVRIGRRTKVGF